jgi:hypothetical protein
MDIPTFSDTEGNECSLTGALGSLMNQEGVQTLVVIGLNGTAEIRNGSPSPAVNHNNGGYGIGMGEIFSPKEQTIMGTDGDILVGMAFHPILPCQNFLLALVVHRALQSFIQIGSQAVNTQTGKEKNKKGNQKEQN